jgi:hypothetical protein
MRKYKFFCKIKSKMLPLLVSKTKLLSIKKDTPKDKKNKEKSFYVTGDNLSTVKPRRIKRKPLNIPPIIPSCRCECSLMHLTRIVINYAPKTRKRGGSNIIYSMTSLGTSWQHKRMKLPLLPSVTISKKEKPLLYDSDAFFQKLEVLPLCFGSIDERTYPPSRIDMITIMCPTNNHKLLFQTQIKALNLGKVIKSKSKTDIPGSQRSKTENDANDDGESVIVDGDAGGYPAYSWHNYEHTHISHALSFKR